MTDVNEKSHAFGGAGSFKPEGGSDAERRGSTNVQGRKMSRIGPPPKLGSIPGGSDQGDDQAQLLAMEADNAIQYRTCSWQKVRRVLPKSSREGISASGLPGNPFRLDDSCTVKTLHFLNMSTVRWLLT
jgi:hypothetical protein